jgi:DNA adenine methylase
MIPLIDGKRRGGGNHGAIDVIKLYDKAGTLFYCDPPYPHETRGDAKAYGFEMITREHRQLAAALGRIKGKAAVSSYRCELMDTLYRDWRRVDAPVKDCRSIKKPRHESV